MQPTAQGKHVVLTIYCSSSTHADTHVPLSLKWMHLRNKRKHQLKG